MVKTGLLLLCFFVMSFSAHAGSYTKNLWQKNNLVICFESTPQTVTLSKTEKVKVSSWNEANKKIIKNWVNSEFTKAHTGIYFSGWEDCSKESSADVVLYYNSNSKNNGGLHGVAATLGPLNIFEGHLSAKNFVVIANTGMRKYTVIHEFGHVAGLDHEHNHPDALKFSQKKCHWNKPEENPSITYDTFDEDSLMSYCNRNKTNLSLQDAELLRRLYPQP